MHFSLTLVKIPSSLNAILLWLVGLVKIHMASVLGPVKLSRRGWSWAFLQVHTFPSGILGQAYFEFQLVKITGLCIHLPSSSPWGSRAASSPSFSVFQCNTRIKICSYVSHFPIYEGSSPITMHLFHSTPHFFLRSTKIPLGYKPVPRETQMSRILHWDQISALTVTHLLIHSQKKYKDFIPPKYESSGFFFFPKVYCIRQPATGCLVWDTSFVEDSPITLAQTSASKWE